MIITNIQKTIVTDFEVDLNKNSPFMLQKFMHKTCTKYRQQQNI